MSQQVTLDLPSFATRLTRSMVDAGLDRHAVAAAVGAHPNRVGDWMRAVHAPSLRHLVPLASALHVDVEWLLTGRPRPAAGQPPAALRNREAVDVARELALLAPRLVPLAERAQRAAGRA